MTPRPALSSGTSDSGMSSSLRFSPTIAIVSPATSEATRAAAPLPGRITCLPLRVWASTSSAGQLVDAERVEAAIGGEDEKLVGSLRLDGEAPLVAVLVFYVVELDGMALGGAHPALGRDQDGDRLAFDQRL